MLLERVVRQSPNHSIIYLRMKERNSFEHEDLLSLLERMYVLIAKKWSRIELNGKVYLRKSMNLRRKATPLRSN